MKGFNTDRIRAGAEAIDFRGRGSRGALLLHGFGDTPQTLRLLALRLKKDGYAVRAPLLPGHGRTMAAFSASSADEWVDAARSELLEMRRRESSVALLGLSMGGAIATILAAELPDIPALVLIAPYLAMQRHVAIAATMHMAWGRFAGEIDGSSPRSILDPNERKKNLAYGSVTGGTLHQLLRVVRMAKRSLPGVRSPTLLIQSSEDPRCSPRTARRAIASLGTSEKKLVMTSGAGHVITVDYGREKVFDEVSSWLTLHRGEGTTAASR
ncbi:MAG TPA: alpha/beta fold hydrolase [Gemmatimonadaceae bacterium]|nr:alpha/beta fold hydrolase [Gemmatimonadaceae bacterium]